MTAFFDTLFGHASHANGHKSLLDRLNSVSSLYRSRVRLAQLDDQMLADIGVSRNDAEAEAERPVWDAPNTWKL